MSTTSLLISAFAPFPSLTISLPSSTHISDVYESLTQRYPTLPSSLDSANLVLTTNNGSAPLPDATLSSLLQDEEGGNLVTLRLTPLMMGGKGGFGSQLRAAGGRMSSQKTSNNDSCRDLSGRRLSTIKEAKKLAEYLESEPERLAARAEAQRQKLENLEKKLGITPSTSNGEGSSTTIPSTAEIVENVLAAKKNKFDDHEYMDQTKELAENVKSAVSAAFLKKRKAKAKANGTASAEAEGSAPKKVKLSHPGGEEATETPKEKVEEQLKTLPAIPNAVALDAIGA